MKIDCLIDWYKVTAWKYALQWEDH